MTSRMAASEPVALPRAPAGQDDLAELVHDAVGRAELAAAQRALARDELPEGVHALLILARVLPLHIAAARICGPAMAHEAEQPQCS